MATLQNPKRQHIAPSSYLKGFVNKKDLFWVYDRKQNCFNEQGAINTLVQNYFYCFRDKNGDRCFEIENFLANKVESGISIIITKLDKGELITNEEKERLALFASFQFYRTAAFRKDILDIHQESIKHFTKLSFGNKNFVEKFIKKVNQEGELKIHRTTEDIMKIMSDTDFKINLPKEYHLESMLNNGFRTANYFMQMDWLVLRAPQNSSFVTSDDPFTIIPPSNYSEIWGVGFLTKGARKLLPLSSHICLAMLDKGNKIHERNIDRKHVRGINSCITGTCERFLIGRDENLLNS